MVEEQHLRFSGLDWFPKPEKKIAITIGGAGGIGSWTAFLLNRIGYEISIFDFDKVEKHNLAGQLFSSSYVGRPKVFAVQDILKSFNLGICSSYNEMIDENFELTTPYVISAFDNMQARSSLFQSFINYCNSQQEYISNIAEREGFVDEARYAISEQPLFIDGRLEAEQLQIFCVTPENFDKYEETLFNDNDVADAPCTFKQTSHNANLIASFIVSLFTNHITNLVLEENIREVPFKTEFSIPFLHLEKEM